MYSASLFSIPAKRLRRSSTGTSARSASMDRCDAFPNSCGLQTRFVHALLGRQQGRAGHGDLAALLGAVLRREGAARIGVEPPMLSLGAC
jgi:hypothetical protein